MSPSWTAFSYEAANSLLSIHHVDVVYHEWSTFSAWTKNKSYIFPQMEIGLIFKINIKMYSKCCSMGIEKELLMAKTFRFRDE